MTYAEAMRRYGSDKPDLRIALELTDVAEHVQARRIQGVLGRRERSGRPRRGAARAEGGELTRKQLDDSALRREVRREGPGVDPRRRSRKGREGLTSPIVKFLDDARIDGIFARRAPRPATCCLRRGPYQIVSDVHGRAAAQGRARNKGLVENPAPALGRRTSRCSSTTTSTSANGALHHPFTAPQGGTTSAAHADPRTRSAAATTWC
jgi:aspartyl-tRNA synthetase